MEAAFWSWTHDTPAAHIYGIYTSQHSCRTTIYHAREQLHSLQQTMYFDENIYPHLPPALLDRILRVRALVNHATDDLTAALDHIEAIGRFPPDQLKGKGKGQGKSKSKTYDHTELTDDPTTSIHQSDLIYPFTPPQTMAPPCTTPPPLTHTTTLEPSQQVASQQTATPDFPHTAHAPKPSYTCMRSANSCISPPRPVNLFPTTPSQHTFPQQCDSTQVYNIRIPLQGQATLTAIGPISAPLASPSNSTPTIYCLPTPTNIRPNHPEAGTGPPGPWWDDAGAPP